MPVIKHMHMHRGRQERFIITLEDEQELVLTPEIVLKYGIAPQKDFSEQQFVQILQEDSIRQAKDQALRYLTLRPHSRVELTRKMREKGFRREVIDHTLDALEKIELVNDEDFARLYIQNELRLRPVGRLLLSQKLAQRGIPRELYEPLLIELFTEEQEIEIARQLTAKFRKSHTRDKGQKLREKLVRYLQGKGFTWEQIRRVIDSREEE